MSETLVLAGVVLAFLGFAVVLLAILSVLPPTAANVRDLWPVMISELVIVGVVLGFVLPGGVVTALGVTLLAGRCGWEAASVVFGPAPGARAAALGLGAAAAAAVLLAHFDGTRGAVAGLIVAAVAVAAAIRATGAKDRDAGPLLVAFPLAALVGFSVVAARPSGGALLLVALILVETMDSCAVLGGRLLGRHKAFPRLSPRKTVEGLLAGLVGVTVAAFVLGLEVMGWSPGRIAPIAIVAAATTVAGDLVASWIKRRVGVKDYPQIHPVQGGALDVVDAWIVTTPVLALALSLA